jgi:hypothetical protein
MTNLPDRHPELGGGLEAMIMIKNLLFSRALFLVAALNIGAAAVAAQKTETGFLNRSVTGE